jgi:hypothetical protein
LPAARDRRRSKQIRAEAWERFPLPVECERSSIRFVAQEVRKLGATEIALRQGGGKKDGPVITENGNFLLDCRFAAISPELEKEPKTITGVFESGIFWGFDYLGLGPYCGARFNLALGRAAPQPFEDIALDLGRSFLALSCHPLDDLDGTPVADAERKVAVSLRLFTELIGCGDIRVRHSKPHLVHAHEVDMVRTWARAGAKLRILFASCCKTVAGAPWHSARRSTPELDPSRARNETRQRYGKLQGSVASSQAAMSRCIAFPTNEMVTTPMRAMKTARINARRGVKLLR